MNTKREHPLARDGNSYVAPAELDLTEDQDSGVAIRGLFDANYLSLVRLAAAILRDQSWAEDIVQDCFAQVQTKWATLRNHDRAVSYLRRSVINSARTELRRRRVRSPRAADCDPIQPVLDIEDAAMTNLRNSELLEAIASLPPRQREVTLLRFLLELSIAETAATLRITQGAVMASQSRAISALRTRLGALI